MLAGQPADQRVISDLAATSTLRVGSSRIRILGQVAACARSASADSRRLCPDGLVRTLRLDRERAHRSWPRALPARPYPWSGTAPIEAARSGCTARRASAPRRTAAVLRHHGDPEGERSGGPRDPHGPPRIHLASPPGPAVQGTRHLASPTHRASPTTSPPQIEGDIAKVLLRPRPCTSSCRLTATAP
jgi:hypothetical protein